VFKSGVTEAARAHVVARNAGVKSLADAETRIIDEVEIHSFAVAGLDA